LKKPRKIELIFLSMSIIISLFSPHPAKAQSHEVSIRSVFQSMGYKVSQKGKNIKLTREQDDVILLKLNSKKAVKNGRNYSLKKAIRYDKKKKRNMIGVLDVYGLAKEDKKEKHYRVKKGDNLAVIAKRFKVKVADLKKWNNLTSNLIVPGQHLHTREPVYIVQKGDSIWEIAHKTESSIVDIKKVNNLALDIVYPEQKLLLPTQQAVKPPKVFSDGVFPLAQETYDPFNLNFGDGRSFSTNGNARTHEGIDIMTSKWVPVFSATEGRVVRYGWNTYGGYRITIKAPNGIQLYYAHFMGYPPGLKNGQRVSKVS
jgi:peptidoglycan LD-endopeptidase LytH